MMTSEEFKQDVFSWAKEVGVQPREIHIRPMKRKLASCSSRGRLTFDVSLLNEGTERRLKAVLHELLHLRYPNHGKMFSSMLEAYIRKGIGEDIKRGFTNENL